MPDSASIARDLATICHQVVVIQKTDTGRFRPTSNQIHFFTLVWWLKKRGSIPPENPLPGQEVSAVTERAEQVAHHLDEWGATVAGLKQRDEKEWELLRIQMEKAVKYYPCRPEELKADALQEALFKIFGLLDKMCDGRTLEETGDIVALVADAQTTLTNIYDFGSPFYAFAKRIARNQLITRLRRDGRESAYFIPLENVAYALSTDPPPQTPREENETLSKTLLQLQIDLTRLLEIVESHLTPKPRQVVLHTLAARPRFWLALEVTGMAPPEGISSKTGFTMDAEIAQAVGTTENSVRVHRRNAKKQVQEIDPIVGLLLEGLITRGGDLRAGREWKARSEE
jgi:DNA-directed RNA polymerase specialized sigma24 family protein